MTNQTDFLVLVSSLNSAIFFLKLSEKCFPDASSTINGDEMGTVRINAFV